MENVKKYTEAYSPTLREFTKEDIRKRNIRKRIGYIITIINYLAMLIVGITFVYPFAWMFIMSLRDFNSAISFSPSLIVTDPQWVNYINAWEKANFSHFLGNSVQYSLLVLGTQYFTIVPAAYAFAKLKFKGTNYLWSIKTLGMMLPGEATLLPIYFFYSKLGLVDTWTGLVLPSLFSMFGIYMFTNAFKQIPNEIIESAKLDKAKNRTIMLKIMVPMVLPTFVTHILLTFISNWNEYYWVLVMTNADTIRTLPVALRGLMQTEEVVPPWHTVMAGNMMQLAPILLMYIFGSQQIKTAMVGGRKLQKVAGSKGNLVTYTGELIKKFRRSILNQDV